MRKALAILALIIILIALPACSDGNGGLRLGLPTGVVYPSIDPDESLTEDIPVSHTFVFEGVERTISVTVDGSVYAGADAAQKSVTRFGNARENDWIEDYYPAFIGESHQDAFYDAVLQQMRAIRDAEGLDSDRYAELMVVFVQSIEYRTDPVDLSPKFPVETFVEKNGDCDDKTLLLAGLLSREGYDVAVMLFESETHVALGIRTDVNGYRDTGYAFTETTAAGFVGMVPDGLGGGITLMSKPRIFRIDGGQTRYGAGDEVAFIVAEDERLEAESVALGELIASYDERLAALEAEASALKVQLDGFAAEGANGRYNALVPTYNDAIDAYNAEVVARNETAVRYNAVVDARTYIYDHLDDRPGVYRRLQG